MRLRQSRRDDPEIGLTPLIDVVFLLLIFFMVSTTFTREAEITINLPEASASEQEREEMSVEVLIDKEGRYFVDNQLLVNMQIGTLQRALEEVVAGREEISLIISADAQTPHQSVVTAMDAARRVGIVRVSLATREPR